MRSADFSHWLEELAESAFALYRRSPTPHPVLQSYTHVAHQDCEMMTLSRGHIRIALTRDTRTERPPGAVLYSATLYAEVPAAAGDGLPGRHDLEPLFDRDPELRAALIFALQPIITSAGGGVDAYLRQLVLNTLR